jgi:RNA polymerase sigma-70 factor, ECF subfamily
MAAAATCPTLDIAALYEQHSRTVLAYVRRRIYDAGDAEDVAQETWATAFAHSHEFRGDGAPLAWIQQIARSRALDLMRRRQARHRSDHVGLEKAPRLADNSNLDAKVNLREVRDQVARLPHIMRQAVYLACLGYTDAQSACLLGIGEQAFKNRRFRARRLLGGIGIKK